MANSLKITVVGSGYVGMSLSVLLSQHNKVTVLEIDPDRVKKINNGKSTIEDADITKFLSEKSLSLSATMDKEIAYKEAKFVIVATPTNYDESTNFFDTSSIDKVIEDVLSLSEAFVIIKSTIPVGYIKSVQEKYSTDRVIFSPEFLREGKALKDNLYPSRIIVGSKCKKGREFADLLKEGASVKDIETLFIDSTDAEAVKLFANTYLAMRVAFFNELDTYSLSNGLNTESIINGISLDERIGSGYNNPSFGYGGYCLPKDTKQLLANFKDVPQTLIRSIVTSNEVRKDFLADEILKMSPKVVGFYRLIMKEGSDNFRSSAIQGLINRLSKHNIEIVIYEPGLKAKNFEGWKLIDELEEFKNISDIVVTNRQSEDLVNIKQKVFTRDIFNNN